jgi:hypothetical protein
MEFVCFLFCLFKVALGYVLSMYFGFPIQIFSHKLIDVRYYSINRKDQLIQDEVGTMCFSKEPTVIHRCVALCLHSDMCVSLCYLREPTRHALNA